MTSENVLSGQPEFLYAKAYKRAELFLDDQSIEICFPQPKKPSPNLLELKIQQPKKGQEGVLKGYCSSQASKKLGSLISSANAYVHLKGIKHSQLLLRREGLLTL